MFNYCKTLYMTPEFYKGPKKLQDIPYQFPLTSSRKTLYNIVMKLIFSYSFVLQ